MKLRRKSISARGETSSNRQFGVWSGGETYPKDHRRIVCWAASENTLYCWLQNSFTTVYEINTGKGAGMTLFCSSVGFSINIADRHFVRRIKGVAHETKKYTNSDTW